MTTSHVDEPAAPAPTSGGLRATLAYQLRCLGLILASHPAPGVLRRYLGHYARRALRGGDAATRAEVESARTRFKAATAGRQFTGYWFDNNIPHWVAQLADFKARHAHPSILEIGSYEGRSTLFLLTHFPACTVTAIDPWSEASEHHAHGQLAAAEQRFDANMRDYAARVRKLRGRSGERLAGLLAEGTSQFDLIYIDGSHFADDVMVDAVLAWALLRNGGVMIFDDYVWLDYHYGARKSVCRAVNLFLRLVEGEYRLRHVGNQLMVEKLRAVREIRPAASPAALAGKA